MLVMELPAKTDTLPTRVSLLERMKNLEDESSWAEFLLRYEEKVLSIARSRGLTEHDAEDVAQEVFKRLAATIGNYKPAQRPGSFRSWLFQLTRWRAADQIKERSPFQKAFSRYDSMDDGNLDRTPTVERIPAPPEAERAFEAESRRHFIDSLLKRVERTVSPKQLQIFQMLVLDEVPVTKVAELYGMTPTAIYVIKHRTMAKLRDEIALMQRQVV
jgi:RNA polymerase sigma factor (sigma-70 family)